MRIIRLITITVLFSFLITSCGITQSRVKKEREADGYYQMGRAYLNENNLQMAYVEFQKAIESNPNDKLYYYAIGYIYVGLGKLQDAANAYKKAIKIDPKYGEAYNSLGAVYGKMERWDEAIAEYKKALNFPEYETPQLAHYNLGYAYYNKGDYKTSISEFKEAVRLQPDMAMSQLWLGNAYVKSGMTEDAIVSFEEAKKLDSTNVDVIYNLGLAYFKQGKRAEALDAFKKVIELSPKSEAAADSIKYIDLLKK